MPPLFIWPFLRAANERRKIGTILNMRVKSTMASYQCIGDNDMNVSVVVYRHIHSFES